MNYIIGKIKNIIFHNNENGFVVALFKINSTNIELLKDKINKTITITGSFNDLNLATDLKIYGEYKKNDKFGMQFVVSHYEVIMPSDEDSLQAFLASSFVDSCGEKTAKKIVDNLGINAIDLIKKDINNLLNIEGITLPRAQKIQASLINFSKNTDAIKDLQKYGFTIEECSKIYKRFSHKIEDILNDDFYELKEILDFNKIDNIFINLHGENHEIRIKACLLESMEILSNMEGDTYYYQEEITNMLSKRFNIYLLEDTFSEFIDILINEKKVIKKERRYYLKEYYDMEINVAKCLNKIESFEPTKYKNIDESIKSLEKTNNMKYNDEQIKSIKTALNNNITIISGGPGTGKTTIINAIVKIYIEKESLDPLEIMDHISLLAPTGRASKRLATSTHLPASTIHRYLRWHKDSNDFYFNKQNKTKHKLIIVDEVSMIDLNLFNALLNGISENIKLILVGDTHQLPSVGAGLILQDLIDSDYFNYVLLNQIYRQSNNSYIPYLAKEIRNKDLSEEFMSKKDDYRFINTPSENIKETINEVIKYSLTKNITDKNMQVLAPTYKGENGIDSLNKLLQEIYNPKKYNKAEIVYQDVIFRENDKVLQLVNDLDNFVFNGDIGYITSINNNNVIIDFDGNTVTYEKKDLKQIKHAYAITIHKSQGSEFEHVIMPICKSYYKMLYNKLIYTGVSRAKKSLTIIGDAKEFIKAVGNNYSFNRKTSLKEQIIDVYK